MNEEVLNNLFELRNLEDDKARKYTLYRKIEKYITVLQQENKQLKEQLEKAINYINSLFNTIDYDDEEFITFETLERILEILGGDKENE